MPGAQITGIQFGIGGGNGGHAGIVLLGKPPEGIPRLQLNKAGADEPGHQGLPGGGIGAAGGGQIFRLLELPQGIFGSAAKAAIQAPGLVAGPQQAKLHKLHTGAPAAECVFFHSEKPPVCRYFIV